MLLKIIIRIITIPILITLAILAIIIIPQFFKDVIGSFSYTKKKGYSVLSVVWFCMPFMLIPFIGLTRNSILATWSLGSIFGLLAYANPKDWKI